MPQAIVTGIIVTVIAGGLFAADFLMIERPRYLAMQEETTDPVAEEPVAQSSSSQASVATQPPATPPPAGAASSASSKTVVKKGTSTKKSTGPNVEEVLAKLQLVSQETSEQSFLSFSAGQVKTAVLLKDNDRAFLFSWIESDDVKEILSALKQALQEQFTPKVQDLVDETRTPETGPIFDILSFKDEGLSPERIIFLRVRNRLYEIHVAGNGEGVVEALVAELSR